MGWRGLGKTKIRGRQRNRGALDELSYAQAQRSLEKLAEYLFAGGTLSGIPEHVTTHFTWHRFAAIQIWIFVLFLIYTSAVELNAVLGEGGSGRSSSLGVDQK